MKKLFIASAIMLVVSVNLLVISNNLLPSILTDVLYWNGILILIVGLILFIYSGMALISDSNKG